jgi:hypothetical protein
MTETGSPRIAEMVRRSFAAMIPRERAKVGAMYGFILCLHLLGFGIFLFFVMPSHYKGLGIGVPVLAYTLGLRHAFDADHIAAIDNTTRKVMSERQGTDQSRPFGFGFFFSLGHSTIVCAIGIGTIIAEKTVLPAVSAGNSSLERFGGLFGTMISASFLFLIGMLNLVILAGIGANDPPARRLSSTVRSGVGGRPVLASARGRWGLLRPPRSGRFLAIRRLWTHASALTRKRTTVLVSDRDSSPRLR